MRHRKVIAIDLGSSYTKVGVRTDWDVSSTLIRDLPLAAKDTSFCILNRPGFTGDSVS